MSTAYSYHDVIEQLKALPIEDVFQRYVGGELRRQGNKLATRCPWHSGMSGDKNPSLLIYPYQNTWYCYGCGKGSSNIDLVMQALGLNFKQTVRVMAGDFGIAFPDASSEEQEKSRLKAEEIRQRRKLEARVKQLEQSVYQKLASLYRAACHTLAGIQTEDDLDKLGSLYLIDIELEYYLDVLRCGTAADRLAVLKSESVRRWCGWR